MKDLTSDAVREEVVDVDKLRPLRSYDVDTSRERKGKVEVSRAPACIFDRFELSVIVIC